MTAPLGSRAQKAQVRTASVQTRIRRLGLEHFVHYLESMRLLGMLDEDSSVLACGLLHALYCSRLHLRPEDFIFEHSD